MTTGGDFVTNHTISIGKLALLLVLEDNPQKMLGAVPKEFRVVNGRVGSMDLEKVIAAIETAVRREGLVRTEYPEDHALYHSILDALQGVGRGYMALGTILRTAGLRFAVVRGPQVMGDTTKGQWIAVALYGSIGGPVRGNEHECVGLGMSHLGR